MKTINLLSILMLLVSSCGAQIKNAKTETVKISGNCGMCENTIEKAGNKKKEATVDWNKETKIATLTFDAQKTNKEEILKRIALAGYDNESYYAPEDAYNNLHGCCQYERNSVVSNNGQNTKMETGHAGHDHGNAKAEMNANDNEAQNHSNHSEDAKMAKQTITDTMTTQVIEQLYTNYFLLKNALVASNQADALNYSGALYRTIKAMDMNSLNEEVHMVWMKKMKDLENDASSISNAKGIEKQRSYFNRLSKNVYALMQVQKPNKTVYFDFCPMANNGKGANWLSQEKDIRNPYYGSAMLSCGSVQETIK